MGKKKMKKVIPFTVMTTMFLSATLPAFAASGFVFEDWDLGIGIWGLFRKGRKSWMIQTMP